MKRLQNYQIPAMMQLLAIKTGPKVATEEPDGLTAIYWSN